MWTYRLRFIRCGKLNCKCAWGEEHGPYWYGYEHRGGRVYSKYFVDRGSPHWQQMQTSGGIAIHVSGEFPNLQLELWAIRA